MLKLRWRPTGPLETNTILVWCEATRQAALFDPGGENDETIAEIEDLDLDLRFLVNTHGHADHIAGNAEIKAHFGVPLLIHVSDRPMLTDPSRNLSLLMGLPIVSPDADRTLSEGDVLQIGEESLRVLHVPGHSPGSIAFFQTGLLICGDTLFAGGMGRTDLPGGSERELIQSIRSKIYTLPESTPAYPGHGETTTIGEERLNNPFVRA